MTHISMVAAAAQKRVNRPSAMHRPPRVSIAIRMTASGSAGAMPRLVSALAATGPMPAISLGQPCGISIRPAVSRISSHEIGSAQS